MSGGSNDSSKGTVKGTVKGTPKKKTLRRAKTRVTNGLTRHVTAANAAATKPVASLNGKSQSAVQDSCISADGKILVCGLFNGNIEVWNMENSSSPKLLKSFNAHVKPIYAVMITPDSKEVFSGSEDGEIKKFSLETFEQTFECRSAEDWVIHLAFAPDASYSLASTPDGTLFQVDLSDGDLLGQLFSEGFVECLTISPDGTRALTATKEDNFVQKWNMEEPRSPPAWKGHASELQCVSVSPDGKYGLSVSNDALSRAISWDLNTGNMIRSFNHKGVM